MANNRFALNFAQTDKGQEVIEGFKDVYAHYRTENSNISTKFSGKYKTDLGTLQEKMDFADKKIMETIYTLSKIDPNDSFLALTKYSSNTQFQQMAYAVIGTLIDSVVIDSIIDSYGLYTDVRTGGYGDNFSFDLSPNGLFNVARAGNTQRQGIAQRQFKTQALLTPENHIITTEVGLYNVLAGKESIVEFAMKCVKSIEEEIALDCYDAFDGAFSSLPSASTTNLLYNGSFDEDAFLKLAQKVSGYNGGARAMAVGTASALSNVLPTNDTNYRYNLTDEHVTRGYISTFKGTALMVLPQKVSWKTRYSTLLDDTKIYMICPQSYKIVKLAVEGDTMEFITEHKDNANLSNQVTFQKRWQAGVITSSVYGCMDLGA